MCRTLVSTLTVACASFPAFGQPIVPAPLVSMGESQRGAIVQCSFDDLAYQVIKGLPELRLNAFPTPIGPLDLDLIAFEVLTPDAQLVVGGADGQERAEHPDVVLLRGTVAHQPNSHVFLSLSPLGTHGWIRLEAMGEQRQIIIASTVVQGERSTVVYDLDALPEGAIEWAPFECVVLDAPINAPIGAPQEQHIVGTSPRDNPACRQVLIAIETDFEFTNNSPFNGNTTASMAYAYTLIGAVAEIYRRDFDAEVAVPFLRVWGANNDPYANTGGRLGPFRTWWNANMTHIDRNNAQMFSGIAGGGAAYFRQLCSGSNAYGVSMGIRGSFPYPLLNNSSQNWDVFVVSHETGHSFGANHTHSLCPPIDNCPGSQYWGPCQTQTVCTNQGTLMSYCHLCSGGMRNIRLEFHQRTIDEGVLPYLNAAPCTFGQCTSCYADCDQSTGVGVLDLIDFICFQSSFVKGEPYACDCDTSTGPLVCDLIDFICFQGAFVSGCP